MRAGLDGDALDEGVEGIHDPLLERPRFKLSVLRYGLADLTGDLRSETVQATADQVGELGW